MNDLVNFQRFVVKRILEPISLNGTAGTTQYVDTAGYRSACVLFMAGAIGAADFDALTVLESDTTSGGAVWTGSSFTAPTQTSDNGIWRAVIDLRGRKRYLSMNIDPGAVASLSCAIVLLGDPEEAPNSATERGDTQTLIA